jgi:hypothetical protein
MGRIVLTGDGPSTCTEEIADEEKTWGESQRAICKLFPSRLFAGPARAALTDSAEFI